VCQSAFNFGSDAILVQPWVKVCASLLTDHRMESNDDLSIFYQQRNAVLDRRDGNGL
jgi:hypothetical protein